MVSISDAGEGMSSDAIEQAIDAQCNLHAGTGWSLCNCGDFARVSGGSFAIDSKVGLGTRVEICLPVQAN